MAERPSLPEKLKSWVPLLALLVGGAASIAMGEASGLLARLQLAGQPSYGAGALTGPGVPWVHRSVTDATLRLSTAALMSARFPFITPTGSLVFCPVKGDGTPAKTFDVDGGYLENNGIALALDLWRALEPEVARRNRAAAGDQPLIVPMLVVLDNHYQRGGAAAAAQRPAELIAPINAYMAPHAAQTDPIMLQDALMELSGRPPGEELGQVRVGTNQCGNSRVFRVAPNEHPGVEAPLGWVLSAASQADLRQELRTQVATGEPCKAVTDAAAGTVPALEPGGMAPALQMLGGALNVY
ncbi:hypothetical protein [Paractinoplanes durhamensis]|uniref:PNPLA domain-containing protein n=1 Tax=Paractinoplanes durhamensis TaxID=113563 RepID=A0ABQ3Z317_9ACTN|nr:hypothetical protein [Actinoplanes durhamensis]GIE04195.1 hypothetical protein Adu01nite_55450 [Actinoplanes durhamensis]